MTTRWQRRPDGSTWGDWGDDDELGRINLLTPDKVLEGVREVRAGVSFCLSLPLDFPGGTVLNQRRPPPVVAPTEDMEGNPATFYNVHMSGMKDFGDPKYVDVWADDVVTLSLQYSTQWDSLAHVGAEFDADGDGVEEPVYYNGYRAGVDLVGPKDDAAGDGGRHRSFAFHLGLEHMAYHGVQGRGVLVDLAHHLGHDWRGVDLATLQEVMEDTQTPPPEVLVTAVVRRDVPVPMELVGQTRGFQDVEIRARVEGFLDVVGFVVPVPDTAWLGIERQRE